MQIKPTRIGAKSLSYEKCPRRVILEIISKMKGIQIDVEENRYIIAGNLLHLSLQRTFKNNFSNIEYFYYRKGLSVGDSVYEALRNELEFITNLYINSIGSWDPMEIIEGIQRANEFLPHLSNFASEKLILIKKGKLLNLMVQDEFSLIKILDNKLLIKGKVDFISLTPNGNLRIVELKSGSRNSKRDDSQLRIYGEILKLEYEKNGRDFSGNILELWYIKTSVNKIKIIEIEENNSELMRINGILQKIKEVKGIDDLEEKPKNCDYYCSLCEYLDEIFPEQRKKQKSILDFLNGN